MNDFLDIDNDINILDGLHDDLDQANNDGRHLRFHNVARNPILADRPPRFSLGLFDESCQHCNALSFHNEHFSCCSN